MKYLILILISLPITGLCQITGALQTFIGGTTKLQDGHDFGRGTWTSITPETAMVGSLTGLVTGVARGTVSIAYDRSTYHDTASIYVSTSDSSGYYFESTIAGLGQLQLRDIDGVTKLSIWSGGMYNNSASNRAYSTSALTTYNKKTDTYQIIFQGVMNGSGINQTISILYSKIKDFGGVVKYTVGRDSVLSQIQTFGF